MHMIDTGVTMTRVHIIDTGALCAGALDTGYYADPHTYKRVYCSMVGSRIPSSCLIRYYPSAYNRHCIIIDTAHMIASDVCTHECYATSA